MTGQLVVSGLTAGYKGAVAVRDVSFRVDAGEVVALLGPNGAGKTTTLLSIIGAIRPMAGSIQFDGQEITALPVEVISRRGIGLVPDNRGIFFDLTVRDHFKLAAKRSADPAHVEAVLDQFPKLRPLINRRTGLLSGGEQQMLALAKAFVAKPRVLMIDEMSLGLAPLVVQSLMPIIRAAATDAGMGVLLVEQHIDLALRTADRGIVITRGSVRLDGPAADLLTRRKEVESTYLARV